MTKLFVRFFFAPKIPSKHCSIEAKAWNVINHNYLNYISCLHETLFAVKVIVNRARVAVQFFRRKNC